MGNYQDIKTKSPLMNNESMIFIDNRIDTFKYPVAKDGRKYTWLDIIDFPDTNELVEAGFYYSPLKKITNRIACAYCQKSTTIENNLSIEEIISNHSMRSIRCPMASLLNVYYSCRGHLDDEIKQCWSKSKFREPFGHESVKLRANSFKDFPLDGLDYRPNSKSLAEAGFLYQPRYHGDDRVVCAYCHCALDSWDQQDDPIEEHLSNVSSYCYFLDKYVERKQGLSKRVEKSPFDESIHLDDYDCDIGGDNNGETGTDSTSNQQDRLGGNEMNGVTMNRHNHAHFKEDPNLKYWKKLPDEDLLQEFIQVSKHGIAEMVTGGPNSIDAHTEVRQTHSNNEDSVRDKSALEDTLKGGPINKNGKVELHNNDCDNDNDVAMNDIDDLEMDDDQNDSIVQSSMGSSHKDDEDFIESSSNDDYDPSSASFEPTNDLDDSVVEIRPKQTKKKTPQMEKIKKLPSLQPEEHLKRAGDSLSPTRRKKMIKRTTPAPVFEDSSTDQDYNEAHIVKLEKNIVKSNVFLPEEDKSFEQPVTFTSPVRILPTKIPELAKKTDSIKPSIFDLSLDITTENVGDTEKKYELEGGTLKDSKENGEGSRGSKDPKASTFVKSENEKMGHSQDKFNNASPVEVDSRTVQASSTASNSIAGAGPQAISDGDTKIERGPKSETALDGVGSGTDSKDEPVENPQNDSSPQDQTDDAKHTETSLINQKPSQTSLALPESLQESESELDYSEYLNEINEVDKHFEVDDPVEEIDKVEVKQAQTFESSLPDKSANGKTIVNDDFVNVKLQKETADLSPNELQIDTIKEDVVHINHDTNKYNSNDTVEHSEASSGSNEAVQPSTESPNKQHVNTLSNVSKLDSHPFNDAKWTSIKVPSIDATREEKLTNSLQNSDKACEGDLAEKNYLTNEKEPDKFSDLTGPLAMDSFLNENITPAAEEIQSITEPEWRASSMQRFVQQIENLDDSSKELKLLANSEHDLYNDLDGDLTRFIAEMPEEEEQMTIEQWIEHCATNCKDIVAQSMREMNQYILDEYNRAIKTLETMEEES